MKSLKFEQKRKACLNVVKEQNVFECYKVMLHFPQRHKFGLPATSSQRQHQNFNRTFYETERASQLTNIMTLMSLCSNNYHTVSP